MAEVSAMHAWTWKTALWIVIGLFVIAAVVWGIMSLSGGGGSSGGGGY